MKKHVTSLDISKRLKEAGWVKETKFCWINFEETNVYKLCTSSEITPWFRYSLRISAPLATEISEELPKELKGQMDEMAVLNIQYWNTRKVIVFYNFNDLEQRLKSWQLGNILPDALAKTWIYLKKEGLIK